MKNEKKIKVSEAVRLFAHVTGKDPNAFTNKLSVTDILHSKL